MLSTVVQITQEKTAPYKNRPKPLQGFQNHRIPQRKGRINVTDVGSLAIFKENAPTRKKEEKVIPLMTFDEE
jgi:hypothetical protein